MMTRTEAIDLFQSDDLVHRFIEYFDSRYNEPIEGELASRIFRTTPFEMFTHVSPTCNPKLN